VGSTILVLRILIFNETYDEVVHFKNHHFELTALAMDFD